jgi:hypothetical protein
MRRIFERLMDAGVVFCLQRSAIGPQTMHQKWQGPKGARI